MTFHDSALLNDRLTGVLSTAAADLVHLDAYSQHWENEAHSLLRRQDKVAAEAILLAYLAARLPAADQRLRSALDLLIQRAEAHIATGRSESLLRRFPQTAASLGTAFVLLNLLGRRRPEIERLLRQALQQGYAGLNERSIFRLMDTRWTYGLWDPDLVRPAGELLPLSTLGSSPHPIYTMNEDNYALTHAVYYLTDFGCQPPPPELEETAAGLLDPFLAWTAVRGDLDLLGELLIAALALRQPASPTFRFAWRLFFDAWDSPAGLIGPEFSVDRMAELQGEEAQAYAFSENYHTQFVGGILCAVALTLPWPGEPPPDGPRGDLLPEDISARCTAAAAAASRLPGVGAAGEAPAVPASDLVEWAASRLLRLLDAAPDPPPAWLRTAMLCDLSRHELTGVLLDVLLVEAARSYRLVQLSEALAVASGQPDLRSATFLRALEFLLNQQLEDGFIGVNRLFAEDASLSTAAEAQAAIAGYLKHIAGALPYGATDS